MRGIWIVEGDGFFSALGSGGRNCHFPKRHRHDHDKYHRDKQTHIRAGIEVSDLQLLSPVHASMVGIAQDPHFSSAARRIELCRHFVDFHESILHHVFCFTDIVNYFQSDMEHQAMVTIK